MLLGWPKDHQPLRRGMAQIATESPLKSNMYFNYYATQALYHLGGDGWKKWNPRMRDHLVGTQSQQGHEKGSWFSDVGHEAAPGGRLCATALGCMTLEVYYRHMPIYQTEAVEAEFPE